MNPAKREEIFRRLSSSNPEPATELRYRNPFELLVAVVLSAQATDKSVNLATPRLFQAAGSPAAMLALGQEGLEEYIKTIGLYRTKAKNLIAACRLLIETSAETLVIPAPVLVELDFLIHERLDQSVLVAFLTDIEAVYRDYGTPRAAPIRRMTVAEAESLQAAGQFGAGSMRPKVEAALSFVKAGGERAVIAELGKGLAAIRGETGTTIVAEGR